MRIPHEVFDVSKLIYITNVSLDGYIEDENGSFDWGDPDQIHPIVNEVLQPVGTFLYGRRLYELMAYWDGPVEGYPPQHRDFARIWQRPEKIVFSRTLAGATTRNTRVERDFDLAAIRKLKREAEHDISIGGAELAGLALEADLVDECHLLLHPLILGGGKPAFRAALRRNLDLLETRRIGTGVVYLHYRVRGG
jgi:dihydrofolate reductase